MPALLLTDFGGWREGGSFFQYTKCYCFIYLFIFIFFTVITSDLISPSLHWFVIDNRL